MKPGTKIEIEVQKDGSISYAVSNQSHTIKGQVLSESMQNIIGIYAPLDEVIKHSIEEVEDGRD